MKKIIRANIPATSEFALARRLLAEWPGVEVLSSERADLVVKGDNGHVLVEVKSRIAAAEAWQMVDQAAKSPSPYIVLADTITGSAQAILADHGIGFGDAQGNIHFERPSVLIHVQRPPAPLGRRRDRLRGKGSLIAQALLLERDRDWKVDEMARRAGTTPSLVHAIFSRLEEENLLEAFGKGPRKARRVTQPSRLLDVLAEEHEDKGVQQFRGYRLASSGDLAADETHRELAAHDIAATLTGAAAAARIAPVITSVAVGELWVSDISNLKDAARIANLREAERGANVVLRQSKGNAGLAYADEALGIANPVRVYLDLLADPRRGEEQAQAVRRALQL